MFIPCIVLQGLLDLLNGFINSFYPAIAFIAFDIELGLAEELAIFIMDGLNFNWHLGFPF